MAKLSDKITAARKAYIPEGAQKIALKDGRAVFYLFKDAAGRPCVRGFAGRAAKPKWRFYFPTVERRTDWLNRVVSDLAAVGALKERQKAEARRPHALTAGDILSCSWGYEQTNVDFYVVKAVPSPQFVILQQIAAPLVEQSGHMQGKRVPDPEQTKGAEFRRRVDMSGGTASVKISSFEYARMWDGKPQNVSWYA